MLKLFIDFILALLLMGILILFLVVLDDDIKKNKNKS